MIGTANNPIGLDSEEEEVDILTKLEQARNKQLIQQAKITKKPLQLCLAVIKTTIKGQRKTKNKTLNRSIIKFYKDKINLNISCEYFEPRKDPDYQDNPINPKQLILYGVDFLTTSMIQDRFSLLNTLLLQIKWIDSSSCKLIYRTQDETRKVLQSQIADPNILKGKMEESGDAMQGWFTLKNYSIFNFDRELFMRYSTQKQNSVQQQALNKYKAFQSAQHQLLPHLFDQYHAYQAYEEVVKQIERQRNLQFRHHRSDNRNRRNQNGRSRTRDKFRRNRNFQDNIQNQQRNGKSYRQRNHQRRSFEPQNFQGRNTNRTPYSHRRMEDNWTRQSNRQRHQQQPQLQAPRRDNVYYDCNGIQEEDNLSYNLMPADELSQSDSEHFNVVENTSFNIPKKNTQINNNSLSVDKHELSLIVSSLNNSKDEKSIDPTKNNKAQTSFVMNEQKKPEEQDCSFIKAAPKKGECIDIDKQQQEQDYSILFNIIEEISPVHHNSFDSSFLVKDNKSNNKRDPAEPKSNKTNYLDYKKPVKNKINEKQRDDDEGY